MKKVLVLTSLAVLAACNSNEPAKVDSMKSASDSTSSATIRDINSPYAIGYSSKFVMDDPKNAESLLTLWKVWDGGDLSSHKDMFADSVTLYLADGSMIHGGRDSVVAGGQKFRNSFATSVSSVDAIMAVKSTDKNEHWALIWGRERDTNKKGNVDSFDLQETWRFNTDGKADLMYQFKHASTPPKK
jgi:hypothetical protein